MDSQYVDRPQYERSGESAKRRGRRGMKLRCAKTLTGSQVQPRTTMIQAIGEKITNCHDTIYYSPYWEAPSGVRMRVLGLHNPGRLCFVKKRNTNINNNTNNTNNTIDDDDDNSMCI